MKELNVNKIVFSSSATVYGNIEYNKMPIKESYSALPNNPYGKIKLQIEELNLFIYLLAMSTLGQKGIMMKMML